MKKNYISPIIDIEDIEAEEILAGTVHYNGTAGEQHSGGTETEPEDGRETPNIEGTGDDGGFILGSKNGFSWDD